MVPPAATGLGVPLLVTAKSQAMATLVLTVVLLLVRLGSVVKEEETEEFAVMVATAMDGARFTTTMMSADAPEARLGSVQVTEAVITHDLALAEIGGSLNGQLQNVH